MKKKKTEQIMLLDSVWNLIFALKKVDGYAGNVRVWGENVQTIHFADSNA